MPSSPSPVSSAKPSYSLSGLVSIRRRPPGSSVFDLPRFGPVCTARWWRFVHSWEVSMADLRNVLDREARRFGLSADVWDRIHGVVIRRHRRRRVSVSLVALAVATVGKLARSDPQGPYCDKQPSESRREAPPALGRRLEL